MESQHSRGQFELPDDSDRHNNLFLFVPKDNCLRKSYLGRSTMFEAPTDGKGAKRSNVSHLDESQAMSSWARHTMLMTPKIGLRYISYSLFCPNDTNIQSNSDGNGSAVDNIAEGSLNCPVTAYPLDNLVVFTMRIAQRRLTPDESQVISSWARHYLLMTPKIGLRCIS